MYKRPARKLSQRNYQVLQEIRRENERQKQIDAGLLYCRHATVLEGKVERPLHIGPMLELESVRAA